MNNEYRDIISFDGTPLEVPDPGNGEQQMVDHYSRSWRAPRAARILPEVLLPEFQHRDLRPPGHGSSGGKKAGSRDFRRLLQRPRCRASTISRSILTSQSYILFGHSMGGLITAELYAEPGEGRSLSGKSLLELAGRRCSRIHGPTSRKSRRSFSWKGSRNCRPIPVSRVLNLRKLSMTAGCTKTTLKTSSTMLEIHTNALPRGHARLRGKCSRDPYGSSARSLSPSAPGRLVHPGLLIRLLHRRSRRTPSLRSSTAAITSSTTRSISTESRT